MKEFQARRYLLLAGSALAVAVCPAAAMAQASDKSAEKASPSSAHGDIIVTAQRREEKLQDVPIAVSAFNADTITSRGIRSAQDLRVLVPSLNYSVNAAATRPYLRGIGNNLAGLGAEPEIGTYQDGVVIANVYGTTLSFFSLERVEVLAGPQGTLYGRNTTGGAINVITKTPGRELEAEASIGYGNYNRGEGTLSVSGPLSDTLSAGIYALGRFSDTISKPAIPYDQRSTAFVGPDSEYSWGVRGKLVFDNGPIRLVGTVERTAMDTNSMMARRPMENRGIAFSPFGFGLPYVSTPLRTQSGDEDGQRIRATMAYLNGDFDLGFAHLMSITAYRGLDTRQGADDDGTPEPIFFAQSHQPTKSYSQEFQLQSNPGSTLTWVLGAYGFRSVEKFDPVHVGSNVFFSSFLGPGLFAQVINGRLETKSWAVFAQGSYPLADDLKLTVGGRYSRDYKNVSGTQGFAPIANQQVGPLIAPFTQTFDNIPEASWGKFTPKVVLDYKPDNTLFYASYSTGYKAGAFNTGQLNAPGPANPETLTAYEIGTKGDYIGGRLRFNSAFYYYQFKDLQLSVLDPAKGAIFFLNAGEVEAYGVDLTMSAKIVPEVTLDLGVSLEHIEYTQFQNAPDFAPTSPVGWDSIIADLSGNKVPYAPNTAITGGITYEKDLANGGNLKLNANVYFNGGYFFDSGNHVKLPAYALVGGSAKYTLPGDQWSVEAYVTNLTNKHYFSDYLQTGVTLTGSDAEPRMYGIRLGWKY